MLVLHENCGPGCVSHFGEKVVQIYKFSIIPLLLSHTQNTPQDIGTEEKVFQKRNVFKEDLRSRYTEN